MIDFRVITIVVLLFVPVYAQAWGFFAHEKINRQAVFLLPPEMMGFYKSHIAYITKHATDADKRRYVVAAEGPRHYIDLDCYRQPPPLHWQDALNLYSSDTLNAYGILPWNIMRVMAQLTQAFIDKNYEQILKLSADIGHYIADAHVPLHTCSNHNGQKTGQEGIHALWESRIPELLADKTFKYWTGKPVYIRDVTSTTWDIVKRSAAAADTVLTTEKALSVHSTFAYEIRKGKLVRTYSRSYTKAYHEALNGMVQLRMCAAIQMIASYWYTAWTNAGSPYLDSIRAKILLKENPHPMKGKMIGRDEEK
jgi:hypothetical protein